MYHKYNKYHDWFWFYWSSIKWDYADWDILKVWAIEEIFVPPCICALNAINPRPYL